MNASNFCKEFGKSFGSYQKYKIGKNRTILTSNKNFTSSARSMFSYEMSLYLDLPVSEVKAKYGDICDYLFSLCRVVYQRFRKKIRKKCRKNDNTRVGVF